MQQIKRINKQLECIVEDTFLLYIHPTGISIDSYSPSHLNEDCKRKLK